MNDELLFPGLLLDDRPIEEKEKDYRLEELVASFAPVKWEEKGESDWRSYPIYDQGNSGSCVAQTVRKIISIHFHNETGVFPNLSASHIYQRRANRPNGGMNGHDAFKIAQQGVTLEEFMPSHRLSDQAMDALVPHKFMEEVGKSFAIGQYLAVEPNFDKAASIIQHTGKGVMVWFYFHNDEWTTTPTVRREIDLRASNTLRHSVAAVDAVLVNGKEYIVIEDSWGLRHAKNGRRLISREFFDQRCYFTGHFMNFKFENPDTYRVVDGTFPIDLELGMSGEEVRRLQVSLRKLGFFPIGTETTGFYGPVTREAVGAFQILYSIVPSRTHGGYGRFGPKTRQVFNSLTQ